MQTRWPRSSGSCAATARPRRAARRPPPPRRSPRGRVRRGPGCDPARRAAGAHGSGRRRRAFDRCRGCAGRYRDALGVMPPGGLPEAFLEGGADSLRQLVLRYAKSRGPFTTGEAEERFGLELEALLHGSYAPTCSSAASCARAGRSANGAIPTFCAGSAAPRSRRSGARSSRPSRRARPLPTRLARDRPACILREALVPLQGLPLPVTLWESGCCRGASRLPARLAGRPVRRRRARLGRCGSRRVAVYFRRTRRSPASPPARAARETEEAAAIRAALGRGAMFWADLLDETGLDAEAALPRSGSSSGRAR